MSEPSRPAASFVVNDVRGTIVIGVALVPAIALLAGAFSLFERGGLLVLAGLGAGALGVGVLAIAGLAARRLGAQIEVDEHEIRRTERGAVRRVAWADAITVTLEALDHGRGAGTLLARVDDGAGTTLEVKVPTMAGRVLDPGARAALPILERESRVALAVREARRAGGQRRAAPREIVRGTFSSFPRTAWVSLAFALLLPLPALKLLVVDHFTGALAPSFALSAGFLFYVAFAWSWVGELEVDEREVRGRRRLGGPFVVPRHAIARVERIGSRQRDSLGVALVMADGSTRRLTRVEPAPMRDRTSALTAPGIDTRSPHGDRPLIG